MIKLRWPDPLGEAAVAGKELVWLVRQWPEMRAVRTRQVMYVGNWHIPGDRD